jgi:hypothetical protein
MIRPSSNVPRFLTRMPAILVAALLAQIAGDAGTAAIRAATGISGLDSTAVAERLMAIALGIAPGTVVLAWWFARRRWSWAEAAVVAWATSFSFVTGPAIFAVANSILTAVFGEAWTHIERGSIIVKTPFWALGIAVVMIPLEYFVWTSMSRDRTRTIFSAILRTTREGNSDNPERAGRVRSGMIALSQVQTDQTSRLVNATRIWTDGWLAHPEGLFGPPESNTSTAVDREAGALFGSPRSDVTLTRKRH